MESIIKDNNITDEKKLKKIIEENNNLKSLIEKKNNKLLQNKFNLTKFKYWVSENKKKFIIVGKFSEKNIFIINFTPDKFINKFTILCEITSKLNNLIIKNKSVVFDEEFGYYRSVIQLGCSENGPINVKYSELIYKNFNIIKKQKLFDVDFNIVQQSYEIIDYSKDKYDSLYKERKSKTVSLILHFDKYCPSAAYKIIKKNKRGELMILRMKNKINELYGISLNLDKYSDKKKLKIMKNIITKVKDDLKMKNKLFTLQNQLKKHKNIVIDLESDYNNHKNLRIKIQKLLKDKLNIVMDLTTITISNIIKLVNEKFELNKI